jgi:hypothetical protein
LGCHNADSAATVFRNLLGCYDMSYGSRHDNIQILYSSSS